MNATCYQMLNFPKKMLNENDSSLPRSLKKRPSSFRHNYKIRDLSNLRCDIVIQGTPAIWPKAPCPLLLRSPNHCGARSRSGSLIMVKTFDYLRPSNCFNRSETILSFSCYVIWVPALVYNIKFFCVFRLRTLCQRFFY